MGEGCHGGGGGEKKPAPLASQAETLANCAPCHSTRIVPPLSVIHQNRKSVRVGVGRRIFFSLAHHLHCMSSQRGLEATWWWGSGKKVAKRHHTMTEGCTFGRRARNDPRREVTFWDAFPGTMTANEDKNPALKPC